MTTVVVAILCLNVGFVVGVLWAGTVTANRADKAARARYQQYERDVTNLEATWREVVQGLREDRDRQKARADLAEDLLRVLRVDTC